MTLKRGQQLLDKNGSVAEFDNYYKCLVTVDMPHHQVHEGEAYFVDDYQTGKTAVCYAMTVPAVGQYHFVWGFQASDAFSMNLFEGATLSASGAALTKYNSNRNSANTSALAVSTAPAISSPGTIIKRAIINSGVGTADFGGSTREEQEINLKNSTTYLLSASGSSAGVHLRMYWYETGT